MLEPLSRNIVRKPANLQAGKVSGLTLDTCKHQMYMSQISHLLTQLMMMSQRLEANPLVVQQEARRPQCPELLEMLDEHVVFVFQIRANIGILQLSQCCDATLQAWVCFQELWLYAIKVALNIHYDY